MRIWERIDNALEAFADEHGKNASYLYLGLDEQCLLDEAEKMLTLKYRDVEVVMVCKDTWLRAGV